MIAVPQTTNTPSPTPLRLWPGVVIVIVQYLANAVPKWVAPDSLAVVFGMFYGPMVCAVAFLLWWLLASRAAWLDRLGILLACAVLGGAAYALSDSSYTLGLIVYALPMVTLSWIVWLVIGQRLAWPTQRAVLLGVLVLAWGYHCLLRIDGMTGDFQANSAWRWTPTAEEQFLAAQKSASPATPAPAGEVVTLSPGDWPGFRGPERDGRLMGVRIGTDWKTQPPKQLWHQRIGPGWSSFAVVGHLLCTQEQRGEKEAVVCYHADSGKQLWAHEDETRFTELVSGAGPRATPTFHEGRFFALGANGQLNCLDALTGNMIWTQNIKTDSGAELPTWGFSSSPLIVQGVVTVFAGSAEEKALLGYDAKTGSLLWSKGKGQFSYASTHRAVVDREEQLLLATEFGLTSFHPVKGDTLWHHDWSTETGLARVTQPGLIGEGDFLIGTGMGVGTRRFQVRREGYDWVQKEVWTSKAIKPYYNDFVVHKNHLYGFDGNMFTCVNLEDGKANWRGGRYGNGQVLLLADQDLLLVVSEKGEIVLVEATPDKHVELGRFKAIEGKTWNHPVIARGKLYVRNSDWIACYQLP